MLSAVFLWLVTLIDIEEVANSNSGQVQLTLDWAWSHVSLFFTLSLIKVLTLLQFAPQCPCVVNDGNGVCEISTWFARRGSRMDFSQQGKTYASLTVYFTMQNTSESELNKPFTVFVAFGNTRFAVADTLWCKKKKSHKQWCAVPLRNRPFILASMPLFFLLAMQTAWELRAASLCCTPSSQNEFVY